MRQIEFRMFDTEEKNFMNGSRVIESRLNDLNKKGRFIYQQWTGLKDKNGKEVFEGDLIKLTDGQIEEVIFDCGGFMTKRFCMYLDDYWNMHGYMYEVIGNIYENPELLVKNS